MLAATSITLAEVEVRSEVSGESPCLMPEIPVAVWFLTYPAMSSHCAGRDQQENRTTGRRRSRRRRGSSNLVPASLLLSPVFPVLCLVSLACLAPLYCQNHEVDQDGSQSSNAKENMFSAFFLGTFSPSFCSCSPQKCYWARARSLTHTRVCASSLHWVRESRQFIG